jgi:glutamate N-acetyltransferase/amino-acid N-acetyltransferase
MADMQWIDGGITAVPGILAAGITAGIKPSGKKDIALIYSSAPARAAAIFTTNQVKGASVLVSQEHVRDGKAQAIVASSGCSNVCTGEQGVKDAREITKTVGELLRIKPNQVLIAATGVIGQPLPMDKIRPALPKLVKALSPQGGRSAAEAIMTTDTRLKEAALRVEVGGRPIPIGGIAPASGATANAAGGVRRAVASRAFARDLLFMAALTPPGCAGLVFRLAPGASPKAPSAACFRHS